LKKEEELYLLSKERGFLATVGADESPTVVPVCYAYREGRIYTMVDSKPKRKGVLWRVRNIESRPEVAFIVDTYSDDWRKLSYLLVHGRASVLKEGEEAREARRLLVARYPQYRWLGAGEGTVIRVDIASVRYWRFSQSYVESPFLQPV
jgi:PPOX class probable F420-dependent enzyme